MAGRNKKKVLSRDLVEFDGVEFVFSVDKRGIIKKVDFRDVQSLVCSGVVDLYLIKNTGEILEYQFGFQGSYGWVRCDSSFLISITIS